MSMVSTCGWCTVVSFTTRRLYDELCNHLLHFWRPGSIKTPSVSFTWHTHAQLKGIRVTLIADCSCTFRQKVARVSNNQYQVLILRQCLETFKILTKTDPVYWVSQTHIPFYGTLYSRVRVIIWKSTLACANECASREVKGSYVVHLCGKYETGFSIGHLL